MTKDRKNSFMKALNSVRAEVRAQSFIDYKPYLEAVYRGLKSKILKYTYIEFASDLGFSRTNVIHRIIKGKRPLTSKAAERIAKALELLPVERDYFLSLVTYHYTRDSSKRTESFKRMLEIKNRTVHSQLAKSQLAYFNEWYNPVIRELLELPNFKSDPEWIASKIRPKIRREQAERSLELLLQLGLIVKDSKGRLKLTAESVSTGDEVRSIALTRYHQVMIGLGIDSLVNVEAKQRDISSITVAISPEMVTEFKSELQMFRKKLLALAEKSKNKELIYQVNFQLFPLTF